MASIEIPAGGWPEIVNVLSENVTHEARNIRLASIQTIGYICEEIEEEADLSSSQKEVIVSAIINSINLLKETNDVEALKTAVPSMYHALEHTGGIMASGQGKILLEPIVDVIKYDDEETQVIAMQCIVELVRFHYKTLQ